MERAPHPARPRAGRPVVVGARRAVAAGPDGDAAARDALEALGADAAVLLATHEPGATAGSVTTVPLPPGAHAVRRVVLVGVGDGSDRGLAHGRRGRRPRDP